MKIYVASSWRNERYPEVVKILREEGHTVYDFRDGRPGFQEGEFGRTGMTYKEMRQFQESEEAIYYFQRDFNALQEADLLVCVLPCGRSAHLELGYAIGRNLPTLLVWHDGDEPDIMHQAVTGMVASDALDCMVEFIRVIADRLGLNDKEV